LDANAWIAEWLLYSTAGSALIDLLVRASGKILLPEVVEREMRQGALNGATSAIQKGRNELSRLRQLTKADLARTLPEATEIEAAIRNRIEALDGLIVREPFSYEIARTALERVLSHKRPSQKNNEQFRDCCIWEHCKRAGLSTEVHFVTADTAFYQGQSLEGGLARELQGELGESGVNLVVHTTVSQLTSVLAPTAPDHDDEDLLLMINVQEMPIIRERLSQAGFEISDLIEHELVTLRTEDPLLRLGIFRLVYSLTNSPSQKGSYCRMLVTGGVRRQRLGLLG
jgi:hypothetical protein